jgi:hypothetical protein
MRLPENLQPLVDGDIIRYELGFAAEAGWKAMNREGLPSFDYVQELLHLRLNTIKNNLNTNKEPQLYYTTGRTFRFDIAKKKPYKGTRKENKPWHFDNLTMYLRDVLGAHEVTGIEADDRLALDHVASNGTTVLCSRDKDLRQVPGWFHSWELGRQPSFGPELITKEGWIKLSADRKSIKGTGLAFFYAQVLTGDATDNIPGLPNTGPVAAFELLEGKTSQEQLEAVCEAYKASYGPDAPGPEYGQEWSYARKQLEEQGRLCWLTRRLNEDGTPELWQIGMEE